MKPEEFINLKPNQRLWDTEHNEFTTKRDVLDEIRQRAIQIARSGISPENERHYIFDWLINRLELVNEKKVHDQVNSFLRKHKLYNTRGGERIS